MRFPFREPSPGYQHEAPSRISSGSATLDACEVVPSRGSPCVDIGMPETRTAYTGNSRRSTASAGRNERKVRLSETYASAPCKDPVCPWTRENRPQGTDVLPAMQETGSATVTKMSNMHHASLAGIRPACFCSHRAFRTSPLRRFIRHIRQGAERCLKCSEDPFLSLHIKGAIIS